jgi:long-chain acyl-CoA synthetase
MLQKIFTQPGNKIFLQTDDKSYSYSWLQQKIKKTLSFWNDAGIKSGDKIFAAVSNDAEMAVIFLSALIGGVTIIVGDPDMKAPRANAIVQRSSPACIIADKESLDLWQLDVNENCKIIPVVKQSVAGSKLLSKFLQKNKTVNSATDYLSLIDNSSEINTIPAPPPEDNLAYIFFTSGTTANSKGVAITYGNLLAHLITLKKVYGLNDNSKILNQLLLCHADGSVQGPVLTAFAGCTWHRPFRFSIEKIPALLDYCYGNNVTHFFIVPAMLNMMVNFAEGYEDSFTYPEFKALLSVSAHLETSLWDKFEAVYKVPVNNIYGLTETVAGSLFCGPLEGTYRKYTAGKPVDCETRIVNEADEDVRAGETGELCLKGAHIMKGYWNDEQLTNEAIKNNWFYTGDFASQDEDGFITIKGRKKNLIISGGINIQPEEITECLLMHPAVLEACAFGMHDEVFGEKLEAAVIAKHETEISTFELIEHCRKLLDERKVPHKIYLVEQFPKGVSGKIQINTLKEQLLQSNHNELTTEENNFEEEVISVASEVFQTPVSALSVKDTSYSVAGWDSLAHLEFITSLEDRFKIKFNTAEIITMNNIQKAINLVKAKCTAAIKK